MPDVVAGRLGTASLTPDVVADRSVDRSKFFKNQNLCLRKQYLSNIVLLLGCRHYDAIAHCSFSCHLQLLLFSRTKNNFLMTLTLHRKTEIYILKFFCRFYLEQNHRYHKNNNIFFSIFKQLCVKPGSGSILARPPDTGAKEQVAH